MKEVWKSIFCFLIGAVYAVALIWVAAYKLGQPDLASTLLFASTIVLVWIFIVFLVSDKLENKKKLKARIL